GETFFQPAPVKRHFLQFAFTTSIADGTIERVIGEQKLGHSTLRLFDLLTLRGDHHAISADDGAGSLQLRHLFDTYQTHAARCLECKIGVVAEGGNVETFVATNIDQARAFGHLKGAAIYSDVD